ncbi:hypothetical protein O3M35_003764 [Rhynocoris fuscipes]|uniref:C2H2-type domain-containing protein n=1 Tax=Rhynocoris fuscipes TaxID=488301 RepID=A0AAW1CHK7_9HEMI
MAVPMRETSSGQGTQPAQTTTAANFVEYDDNEWDVGIGDLIIDLDADIEKTGVGDGSGGAGGMAAPKPAQTKMHSPAVEHQATVDKGLKMKIKRTKPGTKHEIVKSGENGERQAGGHGGAKRGSSSHRREKKHSGGGGGNEKVVSGTGVTGGSSGGSGSSGGGGTPASGGAGTGNGNGSGNSNGKDSVNGLVRVVYPVSGSSQPPVSSVQPTEQSHQQQHVQQPAVQQKKAKATGMVPSSGGNTGSLGAQVSTVPVSASTSTGGSNVSASLGPPPLLVGAVLPGSPPPPLHPAPGLTPVQAVQGGQANVVGGQVGNNSTNSITSGPSLSPQPDPGGPPPTLPIQSKELVDVCVGTSVGTITEPDCLGPCEPGTSVTLEGIVWHETEGVLVVNVTWRGKTYVGTLLDCTRHDWAPPRFCDSPTSDMDARTPKGRGKRGRSAANSGTSDLSNFTETRSSVHSKLRSQNAAGGKGRRGPGAGSPTPFATPKVESSQGKRKTKTHEEEPNPKRKVASSTSANTGAQISVPPSPAPVVSSQSTSPLPPPTLLECPEPNCSKKYKHINGLKYHQSHAHGSPDDEDTKESVTSEEEETPEIKKEEPPEIAPPIIPVAVPPPVVVREEPEPPEEELSLRVPTPPSPVIQEEPAPQPPVLTKVPQFKVKPASALMPEEKKPVPASPTKTQPPSHKKKSRKSPSASPHPTTPLEPPALGLETSRDDVQSPAYSDISDDAAPLLEAEVEGKPKSSDKKESGQSPQLQHYGIYPYYGQPPYLVPSVAEKSKESPEKTDKPVDKDKKESDYPQKLLPQHYYQYGYHVPGYPYNIDGGYPVVIDDKKDEKAQAEKPTLHIPNPPKPKTDQVTKDKHQNDNHQILKESIEMKNQVNPAFIYQRQNNQQGQEDVRRFYIYPDRKEAKATPPPPAKSHPSPSPKHKEKEEKKEEKKQEGVKPTMETQGPPPPPTSQYAYIHPGYMQSPHYGPLPFDHSMYRGMNPMLVSGYANSPYLHPQLHAVPRYGPEDLSRGQSSKALDLLQHHASQYYPHPSHKIHELQERAIKSPTPKSGTQTGTSPTTPIPGTGSVTVGPGGSVVPVTTAPTSQQSQGKTVSSESKDSRSPPPQRHVHTHHHTHVGLGYPILAGQYPAPYGGKPL